MNINEKKQLLKIKKLSLTLYTRNQLPKCLVSMIRKLNDNSSLDLVKFLMESSEKYLRVVGFYKKYPQENTKVDIELNLLMKEKGLC